MNLTLPLISSNVNLNCLQQTSLNTFAARFCNHQYIYIYIFSNVHKKWIFISSIFLEEMDSFVHNKWSIQIILKSFFFFYFSPPTRSLAIQTHEIAIETHNDFTCVSRSVGYLLTCFIASYVVSEGYYDNSTFITKGLHYLTAIRSTRINIISLLHFIKRAYRSFSLSLSPPFQISSISVI